MPLNSDDRQAAAGESVIGAVGKIAIRPAAGAVALDEDVFWAETRIEELATIGFDQIEMQSGPEVAVARRAGGEEEQRIFFFHRVGVVDLGEKLRRIDELRFEFHPHFFADRVAACPDAGADRGYHVFRLAAEFQTHAAYAVLDDALQRSAPAGVERGDCA